MGFFSSLAKATFDVVTLPIDVVKDVATLGGLNTDQPKPYIIQKVEQLDQDVKDIRKTLD